MAGYIKRSFQGIEAGSNAVDQYWNEYPVRQNTFDSLEESLKQVASYVETVKHKKEFLQLTPSSKYTNQTILSYGCGPGDELLAIFEHSAPNAVIGFDISLPALKISEDRLRIHKIPEEKVSLYQISDDETDLPVAPESIDQVFSIGVLHHTSDPKKILGQFYRLMKKSASATVMVYNKDSLHFHFNVAYLRMLRQPRELQRGPGDEEWGAGVFDKVLPEPILEESVDDYFSRNTDRIAPISRAYRVEEFSEICKDSGFKTEYAGGYAPYLPELVDDFLEFKEDALTDSRLGQEHKDFINEVVINEDRSPVHRDKICGMSSVYYLQKE